MNEQEWTVYYESYKDELDAYISAFMRDAALRDAKRNESSLGATEEPCSPDGKKEEDHD